MRVTLIHNPDAGNAGAARGDDLAALIGKSGHRVIYQSSRSADWDKILQEPTDLVAVAGGDGIVGKVAKRMIGKSTPLAVLPIGTANNIANALGLARQPLNQLIAAWRIGRRMKFDVGAATGPWGSTHFIEGLGLGLFAETMSRLDARKNIDIAHHGLTDKKITSVLEIMKVRLEGCQATRLKLELDDQDLSGNYLLLEAMNIRYIGPNLCLAAAADPTDGLFDVVLIADEHRDQLKNYLAERLEGNSECAVLPVRQCRHVHIECQALPIHIDDDLQLKRGAPKRFSSAVIDVTIESGAVEFLALE